MPDYNIPKIGDLIIFSRKWNHGLEGENYPCGIVVRIIYDEAINIVDDFFDIKSAVKYQGTLAFPLTVEEKMITTIYVIKWATNDKYIKKAYEMINEEWFYNETFLIISKS